MAEKTEVIRKKVMMRLPVLTSPMIALGATREEGAGPSAAGGGPAPEPKKKVSAISHSIKHREEAKDVFYTPLAVAKTQIESIDARPGDRWFDPFAGKHVYYDNFPTKKKDYTEISEGKDFFAYDKEVDIICSNPPYSIMDAVLKKSVELNPRVISYLLLEGKMTPKRIEFMNEHGYSMTGMYMCKVFKWYGMAVAYTFTKVKGKPTNEVKLIYDRIVHRV